LARALASDADVLLLDEPASGIDTQWVDTMLALIESLREQGRTICIVEHNLHVVGRLADHTYFMELGRISAEGTIDELTSSERLAEAYFGTVQSEPAATESPSVDGDRPTVLDVQTTGRARARRSRRSWGCSRRWAARCTTWAGT
jgi:ABC-type multidrug transport system ATPase subunit